MNSLIISCLFILNAVVSLISAEAIPLKILSPSPNSSLQIGSFVNITVEIPADSKDIVLGFSLSLNSADSNGALLGLMNTTQRSFEKTGQLSCNFQIPSKEKFHSKSTSFFLVAWYNMSSGPSHDAVSTLASVPITLIDRNNSTSGKRSQQTIANHSAANVTEPIEIPKDKLNASITAKGHNTGDTIPDIVPGNGVPGAKDNAAVVTKPSTQPSAVNVTTDHNSGGATNEKPPISSGATRIGISAALCAITTWSIFSGTF